MEKVNYKLTLGQYLEMSNKLKEEFPSVFLKLEDGILLINNDEEEFPPLGDVHIYGVSCEGGRNLPAFEWVMNYLNNHERSDQMKGDISFKIAYDDPTVSLIRTKIKEYVGFGYDFEITNYKVTYISKNEIKVYAQYIYYPKKIRLDTSNIEVTRNIFDGLQKDMKENSFKGLSEAIVNALDNYYE